MATAPNRYEIRTLVEGDSLHRRRDGGVCGYLPDDYSLAWGFAGVDAEEITPEVFGAT